MVKNDLKPSVLATLKYSDGTIVNLTGCTAKFHMKKGTTVKVNASATIVAPPTSGQVRYDWAGTDTTVTLDADGYVFYEAEFEITFADAKVMTFPTKAEFEIKFRDMYE
jgi:hypothetical protein